MEKQHGVNIMAVEVQIGWLWTWPGGGCESGISRDGNECIPWDAMCKKTVECVACLLGQWNGSRETGSILDQNVCVINRRREKDERKAGGFEFGSCCGYGYQDKKIMEKQHGVNIMAVEVQIGWLWTWQGGGRDSEISRDGNEHLPRDAMLHVTSVVNG
ncbi:hypothetical protein Tco_0691562 [Tanacetum coccineum]